MGVVPRTHRRHVRSPPVVRKTRHWKVPCSRHRELKVPLMNLRPQDRPVQKPRGREHSRPRTSAPSCSCPQHPPALVRAQGCTSNSVNGHLLPFHRDTQDFVRSLGKENSEEPRNCFLWPTPPPVTVTLSWGIYLHTAFGGMTSCSSVPQGQGVTVAFTLGVGTPISSEVTELPDVPPQRPPPHDLTDTRGLVTAESGGNASHCSVCAV